VAAPGNTVDFSTDVNKRVEIVTMATPSGNTTTTTTRTTTNAPEGAAMNPSDAHRSEEHTSELQSQSNLVCRLLLEKKKPTTHKSPPITRPTPSSSIPTT